MTRKREESTTPHCRGQAALKPQRELRDLRMGRSTDDPVVLLAEADPGAATAVCQALAGSPVAVTVRVTTSTGDAIAYLAGEAPYDDRARFQPPRLVVIDVDLPPESGFPILEWLQDHDPLQTVVAAAFREDPESMNRAYRLGARSYLVKRGSLEEWAELMVQVVGYWIDLNEFPGPQPRSRRDSCPQETPPALPG